MAQPSMSPRLQCRSAGSVHIVCLPIGHVWSILQMVHAAVRGYRPAPHNTLLDPPPPPPAVALSCALMGKMSLVTNHL